ncbi:uncharacterized protein SPPG_09055 [Spizellomyces punctatus DAOM BR117]|uniref:PX domain-containing protein n=1 Tax=Spizellomyces punctatus (strain DAOM BR117) TaxID=645134 RepID=A0A0L0HMV2_SPIPD|nr:uncharacterized protein SPPG_09055 [Spizellomyces punctatus DAOM BR117]KND02250.1 hypothetical protein SPPG_09055 [Spizellomyces punctatus DAOM BR117]|eukprot:XP_016610289.1 hypothetical protein SPPG_09055 [Spizellomyces punctatus DAOM BR117]
MLSTLFGGGGGGGGYQGQQRSQPHHHNHIVQSPLAPTRGSSHSDNVYNLPPKKVIKATRPYRPRFVNELGFDVGDFFYVLDEVDAHYYEVVNPVARVRGLVPIAHFEALEKVKAAANSSQPTYYPVQREERPQESHHRSYHLSTATTVYDDDRKHESSYSTVSDPRSVDYDSSSHSSSSSMSHDSYSRFPSRSSSHPSTSMASAQPPPRSNMHASLPSPTSPNTPQHQDKQAQFYNPGIGRQLPKIVSAHVQADTLLPDGRFQYTVELHLDDSTKHVLFRVFDDFWALHVALLTQFSVESGRKPNHPRVIPFLPPPPPSAKPQQPAPPVSPAEKERRKLALDNYLSDLVLLPPPIEHSPALNRFFMLRKGDVSTPVDVKFDVSSTLMDLISEYNSFQTIARPGQTISRSRGNGADGSVKIKLHIGDDETIAWRVEESTRFEDVVRNVRAKLDGRSRRDLTLWYKDECGMLIQVYGETDWGLLVRGRWGKIVLYVN